MDELKKSLQSIREAREDIDKLELISNQFRTCFLLVSAPPSGSLTGDPEIKNFLEVQRSRFENASVDDLLCFIDVCQSHLILASRLARELSKQQIKVEVNEKQQKLNLERDALRVAKKVKSEGLVMIDPEGEKVKAKSVLNEGIEPIDKKTHKAIQGIMKAASVNYATAKQMLDSMALTTKSKENQKESIN